MVIGSVPAVVRDMANGAKDLCSHAFTYHDLVVFLSAIFFGLSSFSGIARALLFSASVSALSRKATRIPHEALLRRTRNRVAVMVKACTNAKGRFIVIVDDTMVRHYGTSGDNCYWFDHSNSTTVRGRNYLVLVVFDTHTGQSFPLAMVLLHGKKHPKYKPRMNVLKWQLRILKAVGLGNLTVTMDSWFADKGLFAWLEAWGFDFECEVRGNRKATYLDKVVQGSIGKNGKVVYPNLSDIASRLKRNTAFSGGAPKQVAGGVVKLYGSTLRLKFCAVWNQNSKTSDKPFAYYVSNNPERPLARVWALSRFRWGIEVHFRRSKQDFSFDAFPIEDAATALKIAILGMFLITSLELRLHDPEAQPAGKMDIRSRYPALSTYVKQQRQAAEEMTLRGILHFPGRRAAMENHLAGRKSPARACLKPRDRGKIRCAQQTVA